MADRVTVDIEGLRERIDEAYSDNPLWSELSLAQKLRRLLLDGLEKVEGDRTPKPSQPAIKSRKSNKPA